MGNLNKQNSFCHNMVQASEPQINLSQRQLINIIKAMSYILRHGAENKGIMMRPDGYIQLDDLLA